MPQQGSNLYSYKAFQMLPFPTQAGKGLFARDALDRIPMGGFINLNGCVEREEFARA